MAYRTKIATPGFHATRDLDAPSVHRKANGRRSTSVGRHVDKSSSVDNRRSRSLPAKRDRELPPNPSYNPKGSTTLDSKTSTMTRVSKGKRASFLGRYEKSYVRDAYDNLPRLITDELEFDKFIQWYKHHFAHLRIEGNANKNTGFTMVPNEDSTNWVKKENRGNTFAIESAAIVREYDPQARISSAGPELPVAHLVLETNPIPYGKTSLGGNASRERRKERRKPLNNVLVSVEGVPSLSNIMFPLTAGAADLRSRMDGVLPENQYNFRLTVKKRSGGDKNLESYSNFLDVLHETEVSWLAYKMQHIRVRLQPVVQGGMQAPEARLHPSWQQSLWTDEVMRAGVDIMDGEVFCPSDDECEFVGVCLIVRGIAITDVVMYVEPSLTPPQTVEAIWKRVGCINPPIGHFTIDSPMAVYKFLSDAPDIHSAIPDCDSMVLHFHAGGVGGGKKKKRTGVSKTMADIANTVRSVARQAGKHVSKDTQDRAKGVVRQAIRELAMAGGGYLGALAGNPAAGTAAGAFAAKHMNRVLTGSGDYIVSDPVEMNSLFREQNYQRPPEFKHKTGGFEENGTIRMQYREMIGYLVVPNQPTEFNVQTFFINPGDPAAFPYLSDIAQNFEEYEFLGLVCSVRSLSTNYSSSPSMGEYAITRQEDVTASDPTSMPQILNSANGVSARPDKDIYYGFECKGQTLNKYFVQNSTSKADPNFVYMCKMHIATALSSAYAPGDNIGEIWMTYDVRLSVPILNSLASGYARYSSSAPVAASFYPAPLALAPTSVTSDGIYPPVARGNLKLTDSTGSNILFQAVTAITIGGVPASLLNFFSGRVGDVYKVTIMNTMICFTSAATPNISLALEPTNMNLVAATPYASPSSPVQVSQMLLTRTDPTDTNYKASYNQISSATVVPGSSTQGYVQNIFTAYLTITSNSAATGRPTLAFAYSSLLTPSIVSGNIASHVDIQFCGNFANNPANF